ncbi:MAG: TIGR01777 family protein [Omnitrophica bacterium GWA2_52_8]|nr:MAG: TIGR01777 family protein [Omnitrophica bacterium GWA2_52_8]
MKIAVAGGTGFVGKVLTETLLQQGHELVLLTRNPEPYRQFSGRMLKAVAWDGRILNGWERQLESIDAVVNLAGEPIAARRWTAEQKRRIADSRIFATRALVLAIKGVQRKPGILVNASAVGYYGNVPEGEVQETAAAGNGFLAEVCAAWEREALEAEKAGVRVVLPRIGIVLEQGDGALAKMIPPFRFYAGGPLGSGKQWMPWIHREDLIRIILFCLSDRCVSGPVNAVAPKPVTMKEFCAGLGKALHRPNWAPVPGFVLKLILGDMAEMLLGGQQAVPEKLRMLGFKFQYPFLDDALSAIFTDLRASGRPNSA